MDNPRRRRFVAWYSAHYKEGAEGRAKFMADTGKRGERPLTKGRVTQLFDEDEPFGELAARNLAQRLGLPGDFFERDQLGVQEEAADYTADVRMVANAYAKMNAVERQRFRLLMLAATDGINPTKIKKAPRDASMPEDTFLGGDSGLGELEEHKKPPLKRSSK